MSLTLLVSYGHLLERDQVNAFHKSQWLLSAVSINACARSQNKEKKMCKGKAQCEQKRWFREPLLWGNTQSWDKLFISSHMISSNMIYWNHVWKTSHCKEAFINYDFQMCPIKHVKTWEPTEIGKIEIVWLLSSCWSKKWMEATSWNVSDSFTRWIDYWLEPYAFHKYVSHI